MRTIRASAPGVAGGVADEADPVADHDADLRPSSRARIAVTWLCRPTTQV